jgi:excisionase family DNA binding protein
MDSGTQHERNDERTEGIVKRALRADPSAVLVGDRARGTNAQDRLVHTVSEAAELLGISRAFAYELVARGELPVIRLGRRRLVPKAALLALVELEPSGDASDAPA